MYFCNVYILFYLYLNILNNYIKSCFTQSNYFFNSIIYDFQFPVKYCMFVCAKMLFHTIFSTLHTTLKHKSNKRTSLKYTKKMPLFTAISP